MPENDESSNKLNMKSQMCLRRLFVSGNFGILCTKASKTNNNLKMMVWKRMFLSTMGTSGVKILGFSRGVSLLL